MEKSLQFYKDLFQQDVLVDFGKNKTLTCGLALQQGLEHIAGFDASTMKFRSNTMELYFETEDFSISRTAITVVQYFIVFHPLLPVRI